MRGKSVSGGAEEEEAAQKPDSLSLPMRRWLRGCGLSLSLSLSARQTKQAASPFWHSGHEKGQFTSARVRVVMAAGGRATARVGGMKRGQ